MNFRDLKNLLQPLMRFPIHPQWHTSNKKKLIAILNQISQDKIVLDIGCYDMWAKNHLPLSCTYIGLDYRETASEWYFTKPHIYADAHKLPIAEKSIDVILYIEVLEHIESIIDSLTEAYRVLKPKGKVIIHIPFLYPLHDTPRDFSRLTYFGMEQISNSIGFKLDQWEYRGEPLESATLLKNIAITRTLLDWTKNRNPLCIFAILSPFYFLIQNIISFIFSRLSAKNSFMPFGYLFVLEKTNQ